TARSFGGAGSTAGYEQATAYTLTGQLQSRHLNLPQLDRDYTWNDNAKWHLNRSQFGIRIDHDLASISDHSLASQSITIWHA
ncbi:hypothetical protein ACEA68_24475, partial [Escherichia coli]